MKFRLIALLLVLMLARVVTAQETACVTDYDPETDYFPVKAELEYAEGFTVEYFNNYKIVTVMSPDTPDTEEALYQYVLVQCGTPAPEEGFENAQVIEVPVQTVIAGSTTYLPYLDQLGVVDSLVGMDNPAFASTESVVERAEAGEIEMVSGDSGLNMEVLINLDPDLVFASPFDATAVEAIQQSGLPVAVNADYLESTPLGRAEWGKFIALFYNLEAEAEENFSSVAERYEELKALTADLEERPTVFLSSPYEGTWYMSPGGSYTAIMLEDAGADYLWADEEGEGVLVLDLESVFERAAEADFWLNPDQLMWDSLDDVIATDERFANFAAYENGAIYNNNARLNESGWNDYYESAVANPDVVLADLIAILHPDLLPDHEFYYYRQLAQE